MALDVLYVADTCGALTPGQVTEVITELTTTIGASVGFHAHDFLSLGYANALAAAAAGATYLDCSLLGLGRGGGNLAGELMLIRHRLSKAEGALEIPYGIAIAFAGLWLVGEPFLNQFVR